MRSTRCIPRTPTRRVLRDGPVERMETQPRRRSIQKPAGREESQFKPLQYNIGGNNARNARESHRCVTLRCPDGASFVDETKNCTVEGDVGACVSATIAFPHDSLLLLECRQQEARLVLYGWSAIEVNLPHR